MYISKLIKRKVDDEPVEVWYLFRPTVINKTGDLSTEIAKFIFINNQMGFSIICFFIWNCFLY